MTALPIVEDAEVRRLITGPEAVRLIEDVFREYADDGSRLSRPSAMALEGAGEPRTRFTVKGAALDAAGVAGLRVVTDAGPASYCYVCDGRTGQPLGLVNERWLHKLRTAATAVVAARHLARRGARVVALFGAGVIADELVPLLPLAVEVGELRVLSRRRESTERFIARQRSRVAFPVTVAASPRDAVRGADVVVTLTEATEPIVQPGWLEPGSFLCSMGSYHEVDIGVLDEADRFVVDDLEYAMEMGDGAAWLRKGQTTREKLAARLDADLGQVVSGTRPGRVSDGNRVLAIVQGMAIGDVALADHVLRRVLRP